MWRVGVDTGGSFTDLFAVDEEGQTRTAKVASTPPDFEAGILEGLRALGLPLEGVQLLFHGTTISTNALITKSGAKTALVTTKGFRDLLEIRRTNRQDLYDIHWDPPPPLVPRRHRLTVEERIDYAGRVLIPFNDEEARHVARIVRRRGMEAAAVCFLNSFLNPEHERRMRQILLRECPDLFIALSCDILPESPEFERTATVTANAYLGPVMSRYLRNLEASLGDVGYRGDLLVMHSGGGIMTSESAQEIPVRTVLSGPAAGVVAAAAILKATGRSNGISFDMGGTSCDVALVHEGKPRITTEFQAEWGLPIRFPGVALVTIGAGGGSIAWRDPAGYPRCGPHSAGAIPGPACYGLGGEEATVTDCNLVLGRLAPEGLLGGKLPLRRDLAEWAIVRQIGQSLGLGWEEAALGILRITNANMANALRLVSIEKGYDPRQLSLVAFGGAGPMHAVEVARALAIPEVIVPPQPGVTSALGLLFVDLVHQYSRTYVASQGDLDLAKVEALFRELEEKGRERLRKEGVAQGAMRFARSLDVRYVNQVRSITVPVPTGAFGPRELAEAVSRFKGEYLREYRHALDEFEAEVAVVRVAASAVLGQVPLARCEQRGKAEDAEKGVRRVMFDKPFGEADATIYDRQRLLPGAELEGPCIVEQPDSTILLPPTTKARVDEFLNLIVALR